MLRHNTYLVWSGIFAESNVSMDAEDLAGQGSQCICFVPLHRGFPPPFPGFTDEKDVLTNETYDIFCR